MAAEDRGVPVEWTLPAGKELVSAALGGRLAVWWGRWVEDLGDLRALPNLLLVCGGFVTPNPLLPIDGGLGLQKPCSSVPGLSAGLRCCFKEKNHWVSLGFFEILILLLYSGS